MLFEFVTVYPEDESHTNAYAQLPQCNFIICLVGLIDYHDCVYIGIDPKHENII